MKNNDMDLADKTTFDMPTCFPIENIIILTGNILYRIQELLYSEKRKLFKYIPIWALKSLRIW